MWDKEKGVEIDGVHCPDCKKSVLALYRDIEGPSHWDRIEIHPPAVGSDLIRGIPHRCPGEEHTRWTSG